MCCFFAKCLASCLKAWSVLCQEIQRTRIRARTCLEYLASPPGSPKKVNGNVKTPWIRSGKACPPVWSLMVRYDWSAQAHTQTDTNVPALATNRFAACLWVLAVSFLLQSWERLSVEVIGRWIIDTFCCLRRINSTTQLAQVDRTVFFGKLCYPFEALHGMDVRAKERASRTGRLIQEQSLSRVAMDEGLQWWLLIWNGGCWVASRSA